MPPESRKGQAQHEQTNIGGISSYQQLGNRLIHLAEQAYAFCQFDRVREYGQILSNIPIKNYQAIGHYFLAVAANSKGNGDQDKAKRLFELAIDKAPDIFKVRSILSLGALSFNRGDFDSASYYYRETIRVGKMKKQDEEKSVYRMSTKDMGFKLLELVTDNRASEAQMRTLLLFALKLFYGWEEPNPPDDDKPAS
jgi:tetratricopeptide (TPR) repeat protein